MYNHNYSIYSPLYLFAKNFVHGFLDPLNSRDVNMIGCTPVCDPEHIQTCCFIFPWSDQQERKEIRWVLALRDPDEYPSWEYVNWWLCKRAMCFEWSHMYMNIDPASRASSISSLDHTCSLENFYM